MDSFYRDAMAEQVTGLEEELTDIRQLLSSGEPSLLIYRATERSLQLLIEACIGIAKQTLKAKSKQVPSDARQVFIKLAALGLDKSDIDWNRIIGMRNALVHDYLNLDPKRVTAVIRDGQYLELLSFARSCLKV
jgi:uncharacterized protein YutE (UPF0331/DUF86 family)